MSTDKIDFVDIFFQGAELRRLRKTRGETLQTFAQRLGVSDDMISKIESGKRQPSHLLAEKIERIYRLSRFIETGECSLIPMDQPEHYGKESSATEIRYLAGAGNPRLQSDEVVDTMILPVGFMKSGIIPVMVKGSSMEPAMYNGAIAGVDTGDKKKDPLDFALWKARKVADEVAWESPWGMGRPGWHIECSTMSKKYLGETIDIHAGGQDLAFPHHENEIAQSEAQNGKPFAHYWMHNGYITIDNEKMSKSKGNFFTVRDILSQYSGEVIRFFLLSGHYRNPINFSEALMQQAKNGLARMQNAKSNLIHLIHNGNEKMTVSEKENLNGFDRYRKEFIKAMDDDLNTADAITAIFELVTEINSSVKNGASKEFAEKSLELLLELSKILGLLEEEKDENDIDKELQMLIDERQEARKSKNFAKADEIRDILKAKGITLKDTPQGIQIIKE